MDTIELLHEDLQELRSEIKDLRKDLHGMIWRFVGISSLAGSISAGIVVIIQTML